MKPMQSTDHFHINRTEDESHTVKPEFSEERPTGFASLHWQGHSHFTLSLSKLKAPLHKSAKTCTDFIQILCRNTTSVFTYTNELNQHCLRSSRLSLPRFKQRKFISNRGYPSTEPWNRYVMASMYTISESAINEMHLYVTLWQCRSVLSKVYTVSERNTPCTFWTSPTIVPYCWQQVKTTILMQSLFEKKEDTLDECNANRTMAQFLHNKNTLSDILTRQSHTLFLAHTHIRRHTHRMSVILGVHHLLVSGE